MFVFFRKACFFVFIFHLFFSNILFSAEKLAKIKNKEFFIKKNIKNTLDDCSIIFDDCFVEFEQPDSISLIDKATNMVVDFPIDFLVEGIPVLDKEFLFSPLYPSLIKAGLGNFLFPFFSYRYCNNKNDLFSYLIYVFFDFFNKKISEGLNKSDRKICLNTEHFISDRFLINLQLINKRLNRSNLVFQNYKDHQLIDLLRWNLSFEEKKIGNFAALINYQFTHIDKNFFENFLLLANRFVLSFKQNNHLDFDNNVIYDYVNNMNQSSHRIAFLSKINSSYLVLSSHNSIFFQVGGSIFYKTKTYRNNNIFHYICPYFKFEYKLNERYKFYLFGLDRQIKYTSLNRVFKRTDIISRKTLVPLETHFDLINIGLIFDNFFYTVKFGGKYIYACDSFYYVGKYLENNMIYPYETQIIVEDKYFPQLYLYFEHWNIKNKLCINFGLDINFYSFLEKKVYDYKIPLEYICTSILKYKYEKFLFFVKLSFALNNPYKKRITNKELIEIAFDKFLLKTKSGFNYFLKENFCVFLNYEIQLNRSALELNRPLNRFGKLSTGINYYL